MFGSRAFAGEDLRAALDARDRSGETMRAVMSHRGHDPERIGEADRVDRVGAYVEVHIEQGPVLASQGMRLGIVESITGVMGYRLRLVGQTNHAGSTPIDLRRDALVGAARVVLGMREACERDPALRATVGRIAVDPGAMNVIPGLCELSIDVRPSTAELFAGADGFVRGLIDRVAAEEGLTAEVACEYAIDPCVMDPEIVAAIEAAAEDEKAPFMRMFSGAGHDAMVISRHAPVGMIFVPSRDGISHSPDEWTDTADCELGARVLAGTLRRLAS
jgi:hydantoinase/carbamoylase family amidase